MKIHTELKKEIKIKTIMETNTKYKLSNQAVGAIMMALQKGIIEQSDITYILKEFEILNSADGLIVENPPTVSALEESATQPTVKKERKKRVTARKRKENA